MSLNFPRKIGIIRLTCPPKTVPLSGAVRRILPKQEGKIMSNSTLKILPALIVAIAAALVTQPMRAGATDTLVITENSSTSLTAILNETTSLNVLNTSSDIWTITLTGIGLSSGAPVQFWLEPDGSGLLNYVAFLGFPNQLRVTSEGLSLGLPALDNNTPDTTTFLLNDNPLSVTFNDLGDVATAPDAGTTGSLFGLSLMGLAFLRRKFS
jgi:hypothetical protein